MAGDISHFTPTTFVFVVQIIVPSPQLSFETSEGSG
jgi:hypothetical protein